MREKVKQKYDDNKELVEEERQVETLVEVREMEKIED